MKIGFALVWLLLAAPALAWNEPGDVNGVSWGATQADLRAQFQQTGEAVSCNSPALCRVASARFGAVPVRISYFFMKDGKFEMAVITFNPADFNKLLAAFRDRYGEQGAMSEEPIQLAACGTTPNYTAHWAGDRVLIDLQRFGTKTEGRAVIMLKTARDGEVEADKQPSGDSAPPKQEG